MPTQLKQMNVEELVNKLTSGERDLRGIKLPDEANLIPHIEQINTYLKKQDLQQSPVNVSDSSFRCMQASGLYLPFVVGVRADLTKAYLLGTDLRGANLIGAELNGAHLYGADLRGAHLYGADLKGADLFGANLTIADLNGASLDGAHLYGADLRGAHLYGADLREAHLYGADLREAHLYGADLREAHLYGADLNEATLIGANLSGVKGLEKAFNLEKANILDVKLSEEDAEIMRILNDAQKESFML